MGDIIVAILEDTIFHVPVSLKTGLRTKCDDLL